MSLTSITSINKQYKGYMSFFNKSRYKKYLQIIKIQRLHRKGKSFSYIAKKMGLSLSRVYALYNEYDLIVFMCQLSEEERKQNVEFYIDCCKECILYALSEEGRATGYKRSLENIYNTIPKNEFNTQERNYIMQEIIKWLQGINNNNAVRAI